MATQFGSMVKIIASNKERQFLIGFLKTSNLPVIEFIIADEKSYRITPVLVVLITVC